MDTCHVTPVPEIDLDCFDRHRPQGLGGNREDGFIETVVEGFSRIASAIHDNKD
jgi:hypothetical protein